MKETNETKLSKKSAVILAFRCSHDLGEQSTVESSTLFFPELL